MLDKILAVILAISLTSLTGVGYYAHTLSKQHELDVAQITDLNVQIGKQKTSLENVVSNSQSKDQLIADYRKFFTDYDAATDKKAKEIKDALELLKTTVNKNVTLSNKILASSPQSNDMCLEANRLINEYLTEIHDGVEPK